MNNPDNEFSAFSSLNGDMPNKICAFCKKDYVSKISSQRYCSQQCREYFWFQKRNGRPPIQFLKEIECRYCKKYFKRTRIQTIYCSKECHQKYINTTIRRDKKLAAISMMGGACSRCGYSRCLKALEFHHLDRKTKKYNMAKMFVHRGMEEIKEELKKCILVCSNCHKEIEYELSKNSKQWI